MAVSMKMSMMVGHCFSASSRYAWLASVCVRACLHHPQCPLSMNLF